MDTVKRVVVPWMWHAMVDVVIMHVVLLVAFVQWDTVGWCYVVVVYVVYVVVF